MKIPVLIPSTREVVTLFDGSLLHGTEAHEERPIGNELLAKRFARLFLNSGAFKAIGSVGDERLGQAYALYAPHDALIEHARMITTSHDIDRYLETDDQRLQPDVELVRRSLHKYDRLMHS